MLNSAAQHDPNRAQVLVTYLRDPRDHEFQIPEIASRLGIAYAEVADGSPLDWSCLKKLTHILRAHQLTILHAHDDKTLLYGWLLKMMIPGLRIMYTCHSHAIYKRDDFSCLKEYFAFKVRQKLQIFLMRRYLKPIVTVSEDTRRRLVANGLPERKVAVLHNGIDVDFWQRDLARPALRGELGVKPEDFLVGTVARITYDKDLPTFYRVAEEIARRNANVTFVIVGDGYGDELSRARLEVSRRGLDRFVRFTGHRNDLRDIYASFDIFLMTSRTEGMPNTLLEAMALGVPSVSTNVGGIPELIRHGEEGFLASVGDAEELADSVLRFINDRALLKQCGRASRSRIEKDFSFSRRVRLMEDYYAWFAGQGSCPRPDAANIN